MNLDGPLLTPLLARLAAGMAGLALIAFVAGALALVFIRWFDLQAAAYRAGLRQFLTGIRASIFLDRGLAPGRALLFQMTDAEAKQIVNAGLTEQKNRLGTGLNLELRIRMAVLHPDVLADFRGAERDEVQASLLKQVGPIEERWQRRLHFTCAACALLVAVLLQFSALEIVASGSGQMPFPDSVWGDGIRYFTTDPDRWSHWIGVLLTSALCGLATSRVLLRRFTTQARDDKPGPPPIPTLPDSPEPPEIGEIGRPIRAINFSSGGFDTLMHLGVIHSLVVIQGRAPDVVVGLSAGAIHATALAEVLQAGDEAETRFLKELHQREWKSLSDREKHELQRLRVLARVERLRHFIECAQRAPGRLLDAILPDAYQIDAGQPLQPLQQPRLSQRERAERREFVVTRSGLARLYNDVLNVPLRISTLTKVARRVLGLVAANDIGNFWRRQATRVVELMRLWILLGANLLSVARLARVVDSAMLRLWSKPVRDTTAAGLIFRLRSTRWLRHSIVVVFLVIVFFAIWAAMSFTLVPIAGFIAVLMLVWFWSQGDSTAKLHVFDGVQGFAPLIGMASAGFVGFALSIALLRETASPEEILRGLTPLPWWDAWLYCLLFSAALTTAVLLVIAYIRFNPSPRSFADRFLAAYGLDDAIFREHGLRSFLAEIFDPDYYSRASMNRAVEAALDGRASCMTIAEEQKPARTLADFFDVKKRLDRERIHVGIAVANTESGALEVVRADVPIVDALVAATAVTPWLPAVEMLRKDKNGSVRNVLYVDGGNVSREPTHALLKLMRDRRKKGEGVGELHIYSVSPFPLTPGETGTALTGDEEITGDQGHVPEGHPGKRFHPYLDLVDIVWRAMRLQRFRDAGLERKLTHLFTSAIPAGRNVFPVPRDPPPKSPTERRNDNYYRARVKPIELEYDSDLNRRLYRGAKSDRRRIIAESIADGCRAAMQVMIASSIRKTGSIVVEPDGSERIVARCSAAVAAHLRKCGLSIDREDGRVPGSNPALGPGLSEICEHCTLRRPVVGRSSAPAPANPAAAPADHCAQSLRVAKLASVDEDWPHERFVPEPTPPTAPQSAEEPPETADQIEMAKAWQDFARQQKELAKRVNAKPWPANRDNPGVPETRDEPCKRPLISLLFSGGVFRGVYQVGVLNALNQLKLKPDIIAGASIGSVTAAMIAEAFSIRHEVAKRTRIGRLAATYLSVDRLILTDRLADFVRSLTLRASETRFSIREADRVFRRYDQPSLRQFDRSLRRVVAGMERLLYLSPYHLNDIVRAFRDTDSQRLTALLNDTVQRFLDRMQVGDEALGAEALRDLISNYVIGNEKDQLHPEGLTIEGLRARSQILFLATATNLSRGRLEVLGSLPIYGTGKTPVLDEALLASSAFPGVFRPRWSWEVIPGADQVNQFIDGGVMDNLPIDAIAATLHRAARANMIMRVPNDNVPHLIVGASLEPLAPSYALAFTRSRFRNSWLKRKSRTKQLGYNSKLDTYERAERALRAIHAHAAAADPEYAETSDLVDIQLVSIKPDWLCGTFAFHPMLGFRRDKQAMSIAHGCATTLLEFARRKSDANDPKFRSYLKAWRIPEEEVPATGSWEQAFGRAISAQSVKDGKCWLRDDVVCPFSETALKRRDRRLKQAWKAFDSLPDDKNARRPKETRRPQEQVLGPVLIREVSKIHKCCSKRETHLRPV